MPSCRFKHMEGNVMDGQLLRNAGVAKADAVIVGNAHDADPKDVSLLLLNAAWSRACCAA